MFNRTIALDSSASKAIAALDTIYNTFESAINSLPESREQIFAHTHIVQSYMWTVKAIEEDMLARQKNDKRSPGVDCDASPEPPPAPTAPAPAPAPAPSPNPAPAPAFLGTTFKIPPAPAPAPAPVFAPPPVPMSDADVLAQSAGNLDTLMADIKNLTQNINTGALQL